MERALVTRATLGRFKFKTETRCATAHDRHPFRTMQFDLSFRFIDSFFVLFNSFSTSECPECSRRGQHALCHKLAIDRDIFCLHSTALWDAIFIFRVRCRRIRLVRLSQFENDTFFSYVRSLIASRCHRSALAHTYISSTNGIAK